jgi:hypothetical protein
MHPTEPTFMSLSIPSLLFLFVCLWLLFELLSVVFFAWETPSSIRAIYHRVCGHLVIRTPDDIRVAAENGLIRPGSDLIVSASHEENDRLVTRYAIHPSVAGRAVGTRLRVVSVRPKHLVLEELRDAHGS